MDSKSVKEDEIILVENVPEPVFLRKMHLRAPVLHDYTKLLHRREVDLTFEDEEILSARANKGILLQDICKTQTTIAF